MKEVLDIQYEPAEYNIRNLRNITLGISVEYYAAQTVKHLHVYLIPRYKGEMQNPRGGVENLKQALVEYYE